MTENTNETRTTLLDEKIKDAREDVAKAQAKLDRLLTERANRERIENLAVGTEVSFEYGRGDKRRVLTGTIVAVGDDEKLGRQFAVTAGEGLDIATYKIRATDVLFGDEQEGE
jgi:S-adenosylmethionine synthetase